MVEIDYGKWYREDCARWEVFARTTRPDHLLLAMAARDLLAVASDTALPLLVLEACRRAARLDGSMPSALALHVGDDVRRRIEHVHCAVRQPRADGSVKAPIESDANRVDGALAASIQVRRLDLRSLVAIGNVCDSHIVGV